MTKVTKVTKVTKSPHILNPTKSNVFNVVVPSFRRTQLTIIVIRCDVTSGKLMNSKPCAHCIATMQQHGIKHVVYSTGNADAPFAIELVENISNAHISLSSRLIANPDFRMTERRIINGGVFV